VRRFHRRPGSKSPRSS